MPERILIPQAERGMLQKKIDSDWVPRLQRSGCSLTISIDRPCLAWRVEVLVAVPPPPYA